MSTRTWSGSGLTLLMCDDISLCSLCLFLFFWRGLLAAGDRFPGPELGERSGAALVPPFEAALFVEVARAGGGHRALELPSLRAAGDDDVRAGLVARVVDLHPPPIVAAIGDAVEDGRLLRGGGGGQQCGEERGEEPHLRFASGTNSRFSGPV